METPPSTFNVKERSSVRMHFRTTPQVKRIIQLAAHLRGMSVSAFIGEMAYRDAIETIARFEGDRPVDPAP